MMDDPLGFFLTWTTYGTWLPGDSRGWVEYHKGWQLPVPILELEATARMSEDACRLTLDHRRAVEHQIAETCRHRGWFLHAVNCRTNHVHVVVSAPGTNPTKIRTSLKAWATRCLKEQYDSTRENWWSERGSIRFLFDEKSLEAAVVYVTDGQQKVPRSRFGL